jgi:hypothetical protein
MKFEEWHIIFVPPWMKLVMDGGLGYTHLHTKFLHAAVSLDGNCLDCLGQIIAVILDFVLLSKHNLPVGLDARLFIPRRDSWNSLKSF